MAKAKFAVKASIEQYAARVIIEEVNKGLVKTFPTITSPAVRISATRVKSGKGHIEVDFAFDSKETVDQIFLFNSFLLKKVCDAIEKKIESKGYDWLEAKAAVKRGSVPIVRLGISHSDTKIITFEVALRFDVERMPGVDTHYTGDPFD